MTTPCVLLRLGLVDYMEAWNLQRDIADRVRRGAMDPHLILLEHPPTYTLGARAKAEHVLAVPEILASLGAQVYRVDRGGDVTYHGPGQLVGYPIVDLRLLQMGPVDYVRALEDTLTVTLASFGINAGVVPGRPGVWVAGNRKIAAIGVRVAGHVTTHGFALNVSTDLAFFSYIVPCGLADADVTSMAALLDAAPPMADVEEAFARAFGERFGFEIVEPTGTRREATRR